MIKEEERVRWRERRERRRSDVEGWKLGGLVVVVVVGDEHGGEKRPLKEAGASWSLKWREAVAAVWGSCGLQPSAEALKHFSLF